MPIRQSFIPTPAGKMEMSIPHSPAGFKRESRFGELPPPVGGPPARDFIGRWAGRDRRDHRDRRECGMGALARHVIDQREANVARYWPVRSKCCPPLASAERILPRRAIGQCEARKPFHGAKHHPRHLPVVPVVSVVPAQALVMRSGLRAFPAAGPRLFMRRQDGGGPSQRHARSPDWDSRLPGGGISSHPHGRSEAHSGNFLL